MQVYKLTHADVKKLEFAQIEHIKTLTDKIIILQVNELYQDNIYLKYIDESIFTLIQNYLVNHGLFEYAPFDCLFNEEEQEIYTLVRFVGILN